MTALAESRVSEDGSVVSGITDTYMYDAYGNLLKQTGITENDYLYTGEQYNALTGLYYLRARYMNPETGTFTSMDTYAGTLDNPVSLHKYLYANANPVMYTDPSGYFSLAEMSVVQSIQSTINSVIVPYFNVKKIMSWANLAVTMYDVAQQVRLLLAGEATFFGLVAAIAKGMITQALLNCALTAVLGEAATTVLKIIGVAQDAGSFVEAVKGGDPEEIVFETLRLVISLFTLRSQCFVENTLVSTVEGEKRIDENEIGDYVWSYDTKTDNKVATEVTNILVSKTDVLVYVILSDGKEIKTTLYHPFYVKNGETGEWKAASNLESGDLLLSEDGAIIFVKYIKVVREDRKIIVYNLELGEQHTYFVENGVLVHNSCTESPALTDNPYNPDVVENRIKPKYVSNPAHDKNSSLYNPHKTPEPGDAIDVYNKSVRGAIHAWYGVNKSGEIYQFFSDNTGSVHFAGIITKEELSDKNSDVIKILGIKMKGKH